MATKSSTQPAKSKPTTSQAEGAHSQVTPTTSTTTLPSPAVTNPATSHGGGLAELAHYLAVESGKRLEAVRKSRICTPLGVFGARPPSRGLPDQRSLGKGPQVELHLLPRRGGMHWSCGSTSMESSPGVFGPPDEDSYSVMKGTLSLTL